MIPVTAAVIRRDGRVLVARRPAGHPCAGQWEFPGGKVEPGESPREALRREIREELGLEIAVGPFLGSFPHASARISIDLLAFEAEAAGGTPSPLEHDEIRWVTPAELSGLNLAEADRPLARALAGPPVGSPASAPRRRGRAR